MVVADSAYPLICGLSRPLSNHHLILILLPCPVRALGTVVLRHDAVAMLLHVPPSRSIPSAQPSAMPAAPRIYAACRSMFSPAFRAFIESDTCRISIANQRRRAATSSFVTRASFLSTADNRSDRLRDALMASHLVPRRLRRGAREVGRVDRLSA